MVPFKTRFVLILLAGMLFTFGCNQPEPQEPDPVRRKSPIAIAKTLHQPSNTYIKIVYGQPYKRDRQIFGNLVPYEEVWRTGANEATELTTTGDIIFAGKKLEAGTYAMFSIPRKDSTWTIILNGELGQWGAFEYKEANDVMRVEAQATKKEAVTEAFTIQFTEVANDSTSIVMQWDTTTVKIPIKFVDSSTVTS